MHIVNKLQGLINITTLTSVSDKNRNAFIIGMLMLLL